MPEGSCAWLSATPRMKFHVFVQVIPGSNSSLCAFGDFLLKFLIADAFLLLQRDAVGGQYVTKRRSRWAVCYKETQ